MHLFFRTAFLLCILLSGAAEAQEPVLPLPASRPGDNSFELRNTYTDVALCYKGRIADVRLQCYDELAAKIEEKLHSMSVRSQFAWKTQSVGERAPKTLMIAIPSTDGIWGSDTVTYRNSMFFTMTCKAGNTSFYVAFPQEMASKLIKTVVTAGSQEKTPSFEPSVSGKAIGLWDISARDFIGFASQYETMTFNFRFSDINIIATFDVRGIGDEAKKIFAECPKG